MSFQLKTILGVGLIEALLLTILVVSGLYYLTSSNERQLISRAETTAKLVSTMTADAVIAVDLATIDALVEQALQNPDVDYLRIRALSGVVLSEGGDAAALEDAFVEDVDVSSTTNDQRLDVSYPIVASGEQFGTVELGVSTLSLKSTLNDALKWMATIALTEMALVGLLGVGLGQYLTRQLNALRDGAKRVADGDFGHQINASGSDELAETARSFNSMSTALHNYSEAAEAARRQAEAGRDRAESILTDAVEQMPAAVAIIDSDERVVLMNNLMKQSYDLRQSVIDDAKTLFTAQADKMLNIDDVSVVEDRLRRLREPCAAQQEPFKLADNRHILNAQHQLTCGGGVIIETDITALMRAQEENERLQMEILRHQKNEALGTLGAGIAHEINTPVQTMSANLKFLSDVCGDMTNVIELASNDQTDQAKAVIDELDWPFVREELPTSMNEMREAVDRVAEIVGTFREMSRNENHDFRQTDIVALSRSIVDVSRPNWSEACDVDFSIEGDIPKIACNPSELGQVFLHLLSNSVHAIEATGEHGSVVVTFEPISDGGVEITFADNGCGIQAHDLPRIYDLMFTTKQPGQGAGGGLALCRAIIEQRHNGLISVVSDVGVGTTFKIILPADPHAAASTAIEAPALTEAACA